MKLRRYGQFINESVEITNDLINILVKRSQFWTEIMDLDYSEFGFTSNYSDMCKKDGRNPEADFEKIQKHFDERGFSLEELKELFSEENNKKCGYDINDLYTGDGTVWIRIITQEPSKTILSNLDKNRSAYNDNIINTIKQPFSVGSSLDSQNAGVDVYLYFLFQKLGFKGTVWLGGNGWADVDLKDGDDYTEAFIRYRYGYHQTEYGKLWMEQCGVDEEWLKETAMSDLQKYLNEEFTSIIERVDRSKNMRDLSLDNYSIIEEDRIIIDLSKLVEDIKNSPINVYYKGENDYKVDEENIVAQFAKELEGFSLDMELTDGDDLIIWGIFKED